MRSSFLNKVKPLIQIKAGGSKIDLYYISHVGGTVISFKNVANLLDSEQPVYGMQQPFGIGDLDELLNNIDDIATRYFENTAAKYVTEILNQNSNGPYALAGYSYGGLIAFEMAKLLAAMGKEVKLLALFDTIVDKNDSMVTKIDKKLNPIGDVKRKISIVFLSLKYYMFLLMAYNWRFPKFLIRKIKKASFTLKDSKLQDLKQKREKLFEIIYQNYRMTPYDGNIVLFRARKRDINIEDINCLGWRPYVNDIKIYNIDGNHSTIFSPVYCKRFARLLQYALDNCVNE